MNVEDIEKDFAKAISKEIQLEPAGENRYRVFTPFMFEDGDHLSVVLKRRGSEWLLSDEGNTYMRLTYDIEEKDLQKGTRQEIITRMLSIYGVDDQQGILVQNIHDDRYGAALYNFIQAILRISDVSFLSRERVRSTFLDDFRAFIEEHVPAGRRIANWHDPTRDPEGKYIVDYRLNGHIERPLFVFALPSDDKVRDVTIFLHEFERWRIPYHSLGVFENQEEINRKVLARFSDISEKQFSSLAANRERIVSYLTEMLHD